MEPSRLAMGRHRHCGVWAFPQQPCGDRGTGRGAIAHQTRTPHLKQEPKRPDFFSRLGGGNSTPRLQPPRNPTKTEPLPILKWLLQHLWTAQ